MHYIGFPKDFIQSFNTSIRLADDSNTSIHYFSVLPEKYIQQVYYLIKKEIEPLYRGGGLLTYTDYILYFNQNNLVGLIIAGRTENSIELSYLISTEKNKGRGSFLPPLNTNLPFDPINLALRTKSRLEQHCIEIQPENIEAFKIDKLEQAIIHMKSGIYYRLFFIDMVLFMLDDYLTNNKKFTLSNIKPTNKFNFFDATLGIRTISQKPTHPNPALEPLDDNSVNSLFINKV